MNKKVKKEIIFSSDTYKQQQIYNPRIRSMSNKDNVAKIRPFEFKYGFREYLRFSLSKIILRNDLGITFIPQKGNIVGEQSKCKALINKIMDEANRYKVKSVKFNAELDIDELEYWLDQDIKVYRPGVIEVALKNLQKNHLFLEECDDFRRKMLDQNILLVRIPKEKVESTTELIFKIVNDKQKQTSDISKSESSLSSNLQLTQTNLNVTANISKDIQNEYSSTLNSYMQQQVQQKSYHITQNDQSLYDESFNIYYNPKGDNSKNIPWND